MSPAIPATIWRWSGWSRSLDGIIEGVLGGGACPAVEGVGHGFDAGALFADLLDPLEGESVVGGGEAADGVFDLVVSIGAGGMDSMTCWWRAVGSGRGFV